MVLPRKSEKQNEVSSWDTGWLLEDFHQIFTPPILLPHSVLVCKEGFGMKTLELLSSPLLLCSWHTNEVPSLSWQQWINTQPWQLGQRGWGSWGRWRGRAMLVPVRNDETGSAGAMGLLSVTSFPENVWLVSFSSSSVATSWPVWTSSCMLWPFLAISEEVLSAQLEFLVCVWA